MTEFENPGAMPDQDSAAAPDTPASAPPVSEEPTAAAPLHVVYVGPRLLRPFPVNPLTIFRGELPVPLAKAVLTDADLAALFVPVASSGAALRAVASPGTALARAVAAVSAKYLRKEA